MTGLFLARGLSFRYGDSASKDYGNSYAFPEQIRATYSQIHFVKHVRTKYNAKMDVVLDTASTQYDSALRAIFDRHLIRETFLEKPDPSEYDGYVRVLNSIEDIIDNYDFIVACRNDAMLKYSFFHKFSPYHDKVMYPNLCHYEGRKTAKGLPRVENSVYYFPKQYLRALLEFKNIGKENYKTHDILDNFTDKYPELKYDFYLPTYIHPDIKEAKQAHPLFKIVNRKNYENEVVCPYRYPEDF